VNECVGYNRDITTQTELLWSMVSGQRWLSAMLEAAPSLGQHSYYLGAGCIVQTVWNVLSGYDPLYGIEDADFVYYDESDLSFEAEDRTVRKAQALFADAPVRIDVKNQARVHLWYESHFGYPIRPYRTLEEAINSWPTTATCVGIRLDGRRQPSVYAPYGLNDLFGMIVRANKTQITQDVYERKAAKWKAKWPDLTILPWDQ